MRFVRGLRAFAIILLCIAYVGLVWYANRALFLSKFDAPYWQDKFEHSQWMLPLSIRTIGDDGLYLYEGYRLIQGGDPTRFNAEVPPFGKYLIGASIRIFGNGYIYGFLSTALLVLSAAAATYTLFGTRLAASWIALLLVTDPLITSQFPLTMLDSLQSAVLTLFLWSIIALKKLGLRYAVLSGILLGIFAEIKFPVLTPFIAALTLAYLWFSYRSIPSIVLFVSGVAIGYVAPYIPYFFMHHTILDWIRAQKWIVAFYLHSGLTPTWGSAMVNLVTGYIQNIFSRQWAAAPQWSPAWSMMLLFAGFGIYAAAKNKDGRWKFLAALGATILIFYQIVPFWTRYLVSVLPLLYLLALYALEKLDARLRNVLLAVACAANIVASVPVLFPTPEPTVRQFAYDWERMFFQDMYEQLTRGSRTTDRSSFHRFGLSALSNAGIESIRVDVTPQSWSRVTTPQSARFRVTYYTRNLGPFSEEQSIPLVREDGRWRIPWDWDMYIRGLSTETRLVSTVIPARRGTIRASDKKPIAEDVPSDMIWVKPGAIDRMKEPAMLRLLQNIFGGKLLEVHIHQRIHGNSVADIPVALGIPPFPLTGKLKAELLSYPGVYLTASYGRAAYGSGVVDAGTVANTQYFECCSLLYSTTSYDGASGVERAKNSVLKGYDGGKIVLTDRSGTVIRTLVEKEKIDGRDTQP